MCGWVCRCRCGWATIVEVDEIWTDETNRLEVPRATIVDMWMCGCGCWCWCECGWNQNTRSQSPWGCTRNNISKICLSFQLSILPLTLWLIRIWIKFWFWSKTLKIKINIWDLCEYRTMHIRRRNLSHVVTWWSYICTVFDHSWHVDVFTWMIKYSATHKC